MPAVRQIIYHRMPRQQAKGIIRHIRICIHMCIRQHVSFFFANIRSTSRSFRIDSILNLSVYYVNSFYVKFFKKHEQNNPPQYSPFFPSHPIPNGEGFLRDFGTLINPVASAILTSGFLNVSTFSTHYLVRFDQLFLHRPSYNSFLSTVILSAYIVNQLIIIYFI